MRPPIHLRLNEPSVSLRSTEGLVIMGVGLGGPSEPGKRRGPFFDSSVEITQPTPRRVPLTVLQGGSDLIVDRRRPPRQ